MEWISKLRGSNIELVLIILLIVVEIFWRLQGSDILATTFSKYQNIPYVWITRGLFFMFIGWYGVIHLSLRPMAVATVSVYRGALLGIVIGLFELIWYHNVNALIFLLALPWQTMLAGFLISGVVAYLVGLWKQEKYNYLKN